EGRRPAPPAGRHRWRWRAPVSRARRRAIRTARRRRTARGSGVTAARRATARHATAAWCRAARSCAEEVPTDGGGVGEDADAEDDHDARGQLAADAELVADEHDQSGDEDVGD